MKKFFRRLFSFIRFMIIGSAWTYIYAYITTLLFRSIWNFNYLSAGSWKIIGNFWQQGGAIKKASDYLFIIALLLLVPLWYKGLKKLLKANFVEILFLPVRYFNKRAADKYIGKISRQKIRNIGLSMGADAKQQFENKLKSSQKKIEDSPKVSQNIRGQIKQKLSENNN